MLISEMGIPKSTFKTQFRESRVTYIFSTLDWPILNAGQNNSKSHKNRCPCLSLKWVSKSTLKFQFQESWQKCIFYTLVWPTLNEGQNSSKSHKNRFPCLCLKWVPISTLKLNSEKVDKTSYFQPLFDQPSTKAKIPQNLIKIGVHAYIQTGYLNPL